MTSRKGLIFRTTGLISLVPSSGQTIITQTKTQFLPDYLTMIVSKYELVPSVYVIGGYSTQPYQATSKFPMEDLLNSETKEVIQPILRYNY